MQDARWRPVWDIQYSHWRHCGVLQKGRPEDRMSQRAATIATISTILFSGTVDQKYSGHLPIPGFVACQSLKYTRLRLISLYIDVTRCSEFE